jgi:hypothetical protein
MDKLISSSCYDVNFYNLEIAAMMAVMEYGFNRVNLVLAFNINHHISDMRYSQANKRWAKEFTIPEEAFNNTWLQSHAVLVEDFTGYVRKLYEGLGADRFVLPGNEERGEFVHGYEIIRSVMFSANQGFAIANNPQAVDEFVCWQFTEDNGQRDYYWGIYGSKQAALDGYNSRVFLAFNRKEL